MRHANGSFFFFDKMHEWIMLHHNFLLKNNWLTISIKHVSAAVSDGVHKNLKHNQQLKERFYQKKKSNSRKPIDGY